MEFYLRMRMQYKNFKAYLVQQWWKSINDYYGPDLFQKILPILREKSYSEVKEEIKLIKYFFW